MHRRRLHCANENLLVLMIDMHFIKRVILCAAAFKLFFVMVDSSKVEGSHHNHWSMA